MVTAKMLRRKANELHPHDMQFLNHLPMKCFEAEERVAYWVCPYCTFNPTPHPVWR